MKKSGPDRNAFVSRRHVVKNAAAFGAASAMPGGLPGAARAQTTFNPYGSPANIGPSSLPGPAIGTTLSAPASPYVVPTASGWSSTALLTVGNDVNGYRFAGIPDGLGAFDNGDGSITVFINHEITEGRGAMRGHGGAGAFVSRWVINKDTLKVVSGRDFVDAPQKLFLQVDGGLKPASEAPEKQRQLGRFCSADLAPVSAFYNDASRKGYDGRIFLNGEEGGAGRAFGWVVEEHACYELTDFAFGKRGDRSDPPPAFENLVANPSTGDATVVMGMSDGGSYQVYVWLGAKQTEGSPVQKAGLAGGKLYSLAVEGVSNESRDANIGLAKTLVGKGVGKKLRLAAPNKGTSFLRPEDGAWDPRNANVFYLVTTDRNNFSAPGALGELLNANQIGRSRLWAITFDDVTKIATDGAPTGKIELLLDGTEGGDMFDNVTVDRDGIIYLCEDTGGARHNPKVWAYDTNSGSFATIIRFDPAKFGDVVDKQYTPPVAPFVDDKESSGILDVTEIFSNAVWYRPGGKVLLITVQAHFRYDEKDRLGAQLVEGGQLLLLAKAS